MMHTRALALMALVIMTVAGSKAEKTPQWPPTAGECLQFLYRHMSLPDSVDRSRSYYLRQIDATLEARRTMPWGNKVPQREWLHFVLPLRVNNEDLDESRTQLYRQIAPRVRHMSMLDAALEVNHWCHERVTYRPSDGRTLGPLACIRTGWGRCGEESTLTVAAMRAVGIPARQVYTPRWAHTDDNHAWVEVWVDGRWHFLGACEPEAILDLAWFNAPAARGMVMATNVHGLYDGPEEVLEQRAHNTRINVTDNYAPVDTLTVRVVDAQGHPVEGARVDMTLYNYAEFYPLATRLTGTDGLASITAGLGDLVVWASKDGLWSMTPLTVGAHHGPVDIVLASSSPAEAVRDITLTPPRPSGSLPRPKAEQAAENARRLAYEDSIRGAYLATFDTPETAALFARAQGYAVDDMQRLLPLAHGNCDVIRTFLMGASEPDRPKAAALLNALAPKDLCDITAEVLADCMTSPGSDTAEIYARYVLSPRVATEGLTPCRAALRQRLAHVKDIDGLRRWVADSLSIDAEYTRNPARAIMSPLGVWRQRRDIDPRSRDVFFVAAARALDIPARIDPVTGRVQYHSDGRWLDLAFDDASLAATTKPQGTLRLTFDTDSAPYQPKYYSHFTLAKIVNGRPQTLGYDDFTPWTHWAQGQPLDVGKYMLVTGQRMADGSVLARCRYFDIAEGQTAVVPLEMRHDDKAPQVIGTFDSESRYFDTKKGIEQSILAANGRGYFVVILGAPNNEPTIHALNDLTASAQALEAYPERVFVLYASDDDLRRARLEQWPSLPSTVVIGTDPSGTIARAMADGLGLDPGQTPLVVVADTFNRVVHATQGYTIGLGERLAQLLGRLH